MSEANFFKKNFPQFVTEMGECLSPYWDLFDAGVEYATHELDKGCDETQELLDKQIEATYKVVEENNALKKRNSELAGQKASLGRWLGEAKKIIGNLYAICKDNHYPDSSVFMEQAEQFLKEV